LVPETYYAPPGIVDASTEIDGEGYAQPWDKPGLGIEVDWDWVDTHTVRVEE
jgi:L-alanine-DL-glutamate epimerase-like enolase superfamily enzyme